jgi:hypothetical protein
MMISTSDALLAYPAGGELHVVARGEHYSCPLTAQQMLWLAGRFLEAGVEQIKKRG